MLATVLLGEISAAADISDTKHSDLIRSALADITANVRSPLRNSEATDRPTSRLMTNQCPIMGSVSPCSPVSDGVSAIRRKSQDSLLSTTTRMTVLSDKDFNQDDHPKL